MSLTTFLLSYFLIGGFAWIAWLIMFIMVRGDQFKGNPLSFFVDFIGGSILPLCGWPFILLSFVVSVFKG